MKQEHNILLNIKNKALALSHANLHSKVLEKISSYLVINNYTLSLIRKIYYKIPVKQQ